MGDTLITVNLAKGDFEREAWELYKVLLLDLG